jgi:hypothetical protein
MTAADPAHGQVADGELVADMYRAPRLAELFGGLRVGVQRGLRVALDEGGQPRGVGVVGVLMGDQDRRKAGNALEAVRKRSRIKQHRGVSAGIAAEICQ